MSKFTVIVNTYPNKTRNGDFEKCLKSLLNQTYQDFSILIVDNFQDRSEIDKLLVKFDQYKDRISVVVDSTKKLSYLFNLGWKNAKSDYLAYLADDAEAESEWLKTIKQELDKDPKIAVVSGPVISACYPTCEMHRIYLLSQKNWLFKLLAWPYLYFTTEERIQKPGNLFESGAYSFGTSLEESKTFERQEIDLATTTNMGIRRQVLEEVGGFDENFSFNHADGDLYIRIKKLGYKIMFNPKVIAHHNVRIGPSRNAYIIGEDTGKFYRKDIRPKSLRGWVGLVINICVLNFYWIYNFIRTGDAKQLKGISGFFKGYFQINKKELLKKNVNISILFFHRWTGVRGGGTESHVKGLLKNFPKNHTVYLLTRYGPKVKLLKDNYPRVKLFTISKNIFENDNSYENPVLLYLHTLLFMLKSLITLIYIIKIKKIKIDIISTHFATEAVVARIIRFLFGIPYIFIFEGYTDLEANVARYADSKISISHYISKKCQDNYGYYPELMYIGEDTFPTISKELIINKSKEKEKTVLTLCRFEPRKNLSTAIKTINYIVKVKKRHDIKFVWGGTGISKDKLIQEIKDLKLDGIINYLGYVSEEDVVHVFQKSHIYFLPTYEEGFGIVFVEAMKSGSVNVSTNATAIPEIVGDTGFLVNDPDDYKEFAKYIIKLVDDNNLWKERSLKGRERSKQFNWDKLIPEYERKYLQVVERSTSSNI